MLLLLASPAFAIVRTPQTDLNNLRILWDDACFEVYWDTTAKYGHVTADFNNYRVTTTSSNATLNNLDVNTRSNFYEFCTGTPGDSITVVVQRYDGNADGHFVNVGEQAGLNAGSGDLNGSLDTGDATQAGLYLFYKVLTAFAGIAALMIVVTVLFVVLSKLGFSLGKLIGKK